MRLKAIAHCSNDIFPVFPIRAEVFFPSTVVCWSLNRMPLQTMLNKLYVNIALEIASV